MASGGASMARWAVMGVGALAAAAAGWELYKRTQQPHKEASSASSSNSGHARSKDEESIPPCRPLHWVLKVGDLRASVDFYSSVLGLVVQRHEEFEEGCEATCNGPYSGWWSKTMLSFPEKGEEAFSLELTYNYGITSYELGNDLVGIHVRVPGAVERAREKGYPVEPTEEQGVHRVRSPDGQWIYLHPAAAADAAPDADRFLYVSLHSTDLSRATEFYRRVLGMRQFGPVADGQAQVLLGYTEVETKVQLVALPPGAAVDHGKAQGRMAFASVSRSDRAAAAASGEPSEVHRAYARALAFGAEVLHAPVTLDTPGKAQVTVTILRDVDGGEICVVDEADFRELCKTKPGDEIIKWDFREKAIKSQLKFQAAFSKPDV